MGIDMSDSKPQAISKNALGSALEKLTTLPKSLRMSMPFQNQKDAAKALSRAYITAFTLIRCDIYIHFYLDPLVCLLCKQITKRIYLAQTLLPPTIVHFNLFQGS